MKMLKSRKALSPVVASIILIAVTVAVSLAVGGYMFGLFDVFKGESVKITNINFYSTNHINVTFANLGTATVNIKYIQVNNGTGGWVQVWSAAAGQDIPGNKQVQIDVTPYTWAAGTSYDIRAVTSKGTTLSQTQVAS